MLVLTTGTELCMSRYRHETFPKLSRFGARAATYTFLPRMGADEHGSRRTSQ
jgi:hypothetical protein